VSHDRYFALTGPEPLEERLSPAVSFHGGSVLAHPDVHTVLWGRGWADAGDRQLDGQRLGWDVRALAGGPYAAALAPYDVGPGTAADPLALDAPLNGPGWLDDSLIRWGLRGLAAGSGPDDVWLVFVEPGVAVSIRGLVPYNSQWAFAGYHSLLYDGSAFHAYAVVPWPGPVEGSPWPNAHAAGGNTFEQVTVAASHELAEAFTDPRGDGWWDPRYGPAGGEVADLAVTDVYIYRSFLVQGFVGPDGRPVRVVE
jgi:hypothetical protein